MVEAMYKATEGDAIITSDVGQHQMWAAQYYDFDKPRRWINSGGLGTMGFGLPAAIGAKVACPDEQVVCLAGDGSLIMNVQELATAVHHEIPVKVFLMNNGYLGMVRQWQELFWDGALQRRSRWARARTGSSSPRPSAPTGMRCEDKADLEGAMRDALDDRRPGAARRPRQPGGELLPDDPGRRTPPGTWWADGHGAGTPDLVKLEDLEAAAGRSPAASTSSRSWSRTSPGVLARDRRPLLPPRLQHRHARGRPDRGPRRSRGSR